MNNSQDIPALLLPNVIDPGTYTKVTFDSKGRAILGDTLDAADIPSLFSTKISDFATAVDDRITAASLQPLDADLTAIAALAPSDGTFIRRTAGVWTAAALLAADIPSLMSTVISDFSTAADARIAAAVGTSIQAYDADLTAIAALVPANGDFIRRTGGVWVGAALASADIPVLDTNKLTTGQLALARGGTNVDLSATGGSTSFLAQDASHVVSARTIASADLTTALASPPAFGGTIPAAITGTIVTATTRLVSPILAPASDSTTAIQFNKADGSTNVVKIDTTNSRVGIGVTPTVALDVVEQGQFASTLANGVFLGFKFLNGVNVVEGQIRHSSSTITEARGIAIRGFGANKGTGSVVLIGATSDDNVGITGPLSFNARFATDIALTGGAALVNRNVMTVTNFTTNLMTITASGSVNIGVLATSDTTNATRLIATTDVATNVGIEVRGTTSQSADLQQWRSVTPTTLVSIPAAGGVRIHSNPGAGLASTITITNDVAGTPADTATPTKWLKIYDGTTARYLPVYT